METIFISIMGRLASRREGVANCDALAIGRSGPPGSSLARGGDGHFGGILLSLARGVPVSVFVATISFAIYLV